MVNTKGEQAGQTSEFVPAWLGIGRAVGGAIIFSLPMMMTMEMWWQGFFIHPGRLLALILFSLPLFVLISSIIGFDKNRNLMNNVLDVLVAYAVAFVTTGIALIVFGVITWETAPGEIFSMVLLQSVPASLGALMARSLIGSGNDEPANDCQTYTEEIVILIAGSLFLAFNVAPTEEVVLISYMMSFWHMLGLAVLTLFIMHMFTISSEDLSLAEIKQWSTQRRLFMRFTSVGYVLAVTVSVFMLWVFGQAVDDDVRHFLNTTVVLSFPAGVGAAASRLII